MLSSFSAKDLREGDKISVQTLSGKHTGPVSRAPEKTRDYTYTVSLGLDCEQCSSRHGVDLPGYRLVAAQRNP